MNEFLVPSQYYGETPGLSLMFAGLSEEIYTKLELSIDGYSFFCVQRNEEDPFYSNPYLFKDLCPNTIYKVTGRITIAGKQSSICCGIVAGCNQTVQQRSISRYCGGGVAHLPLPPKEEAD